MPYWKSIRSQAVAIAVFVLKVCEEEATNAVFNAPFLREREREREREQTYQHEQYHTILFHRTYSDATIILGSCQGETMETAS